MWYIVMYRLVHLITEGESFMNWKDGALLFLLGLAIWILGTIYYAYRGHHVLETTAARYWVGLIASAAASATMCTLILRWRGVAPSHWASAMLLLAIPGMIGEAVVLSHLGTFMPKLQAASGGRYGAYLFATYAVVLGVAEIVTLRAS